MNTKLRFVTRLASIVLALFLSTAVAQVSKTGVIKIGMNEVMSGPLVFVGLPAAQAVRMAVKEINDKGGFRVGDVIYKIDLIEVDNKTDPASAVAGMTKLVQDDKVKFVFGPTVSGVANPTQEITVPAKVLHIAAAGSWQVLGYLSDPKKPLLFGTQLPLSQIAKIDMDALKTLGAKKVAYFGTDDDTTKGQIQPWLDEAKAAGISVTTILFPLKTVDFSSFVSRARGENVDAIYLLQTAVGVDMVRAAVDLKAGPKGFGSRQMNPEVAMKSAIGKPIPIPFFSTLSTPSYDYPPNAKVKAYVERMKAFAGDLGIGAGFSFFGYDFVYMLTEAMSKAGTVDDTEKVAQALGTMTYDGVAGKICFGKTVRTASYDGGQLFVRNGKLESRAFPSSCK